MRKFFQSLAENLKSSVFYIFYSVYIIFGMLIMMSLYQVGPSFVLNNLYPLCSIFAVNFVLHTVFFMFYGELPKPKPKYKTREEIIREKKKRKYQESLDKIAQAQQR